MKLMKRTGKAVTHAIEGSCAVIGETAMMVANTAAAGRIMAENNRDVVALSSNIRKVKQVMKLAKKYEQLGQPMPKWCQVILESAPNLKVGA